MTSILVLLVFPLLTAALFGLAADRHLGHIYDPANGDDAVTSTCSGSSATRGVHHRAAVLRHRPEIFPVFSRKPIFGYTTLVYATISIAALSVAVWAHHMYVTERFCCRSSRS